MFSSGRKPRLHLAVREGDEIVGSLHESLITLLDPDSPASEAFRTLRTNFLYAFPDSPPKVVVLTSHGSREGKSTTCANLGVLLAQVRKSVLLLDCDFRNPPQHKIFGSRTPTGLVDVLAGKQSLRDAWQEPLPGLKVLAAGVPPRSPAELLSTKRFAELVDEVRQQFDFVLVDTPPVGQTPDALIVSAHADGVLFVLDAENIRKSAVWQSLRSLQTVRANVLGTVMNNVDASAYRHYGRW